MKNGLSKYLFYLIFSMQHRKPVLESRFVYLNLQEIDC